MGQTMGPGAMGPWGEAERAGRAERRGAGPLKSAERARATGPGAMGPWAMGPGKPWARERGNWCVPCYGVMPASFEILPPETLSGD